MIRAKACKQAVSAIMTKTAMFGSAPESCTHGLTCGDMGKKKGVSMTEKQKEAIRYMRNQDFSYKNIADSLGLLYNTVKSFCYREHLARDARGGQNDSSQDGCKNCGAHLDHHPGAKRKIFCSDKCRYAWWNRNRQYLGHQRIYQLTCLGCGNEFKSYGNKNRKYCGRDCYIKNRFGDGLP